jgi:DNA repair protein RadA/Sms
VTAKSKSLWSCIECGHTQAKWAGQCPTCTLWNTLKEEAKPLQESRFESSAGLQNKPMRLKEVSLHKTHRQPTCLQEFDRLVGGGLVPGALTLVGGDPGIGKSTLMLQLSQNLARQGLTVLYISGEESLEQTTLRALRLGVNTDSLFILNETQFSAIKSHIDELKPAAIVVDSIQIVYKADLPSAPGSVTQVRETTTEFMHLAKSRQITTFLIGHVTKSGEIAGPKVLEHLVDTVLYFEGDKQHQFRMVRVIKNRFGPTDEIAVFSMSEAGLKEVPNPSEIFLEERNKTSTGSVIIPTLEGTRPILIEAQALVTDTSFPSPSRRSAGIDPNRLSLLMAVLDKRMGYQLHRYDVFVSIAGGLKITEPAIDLGILAAVTSSMQNRVIDNDTVVLGEIGLGGEIRSVARVESRLKEALHMGFKRCVLPKSSLKGLSPKYLSSMELFGVEKVDEAIPYLFR